MRNKPKTRSSPKDTLTLAMSSARYVVGLDCDSLISILRSVRAMSSTLPPIRFSAEVTLTRMYTIKMIGAR